VRQQWWFWMQINLLHICNCLHVIKVAISVAPACWLAAVTLVLCCCLLHSNNQPHHIDITDTPSACAVTYCCS
jgi:hypothetical protein